MYPNMSTQTLSGKRILILATDGFEQSELEVPQKKLSDLGATVDVTAPKKGAIKGWNHTDWGNEVKVDFALSDADVKDYDALVLPGGQMNPDALRMEPEAIALIKAFAAAGKPVAAVCHAPWLLIDAGLVKGRKVTSWPSVRTDLRNAGATVVDQSAVIDRGIITSRKPEDLDDFVEAIASQLA
ncbi:MAG TPA: type 1 glutamine amidotransferase domain-containing protein [Burkholderiaceae bacterium]